MAKYSGKNNFDKGTEFKVIKNIITSYGSLDSGTKVTLIEITHFPTSYKVLDENGKKWLLRTYEVEKISYENE